MAQQFTQQEIEKLIDAKINQYNTTQGGAPSSFSIPLHRHNGSDSNKVIMGDLALDSRGLIFPGVQGSFTVNVNPGLSGQSTLYVSPPVTATGVPLGSFALNGLNGEVYRNIIISSLLGTNISVGGIALSTNWSYQAGKTVIVSNSPNFALQLPEITPLPATPSAGDITFSSGQFYVCKVAGTWKQVVTL